MHASTRPGPQGHRPCLPSRSHVRSGCIPFGPAGDFGKLATYTPMQAGACLPAAAHPGSRTVFQAGCPLYMLCLMDGLMPCLHHCPLSHTFRWLCGCSCRCATLLMVKATHGCCSCWVSEAIWPPATQCCCYCASCRLIVVPTLLYALLREGPTHLVCHGSGLGLLSAAKEQGI